MVKKEEREERMWIQAMRNYSERKKETQTETEKSDSDNDLSLGYNVVRSILGYSIAEMDFVFSVSSRTNKIVNKFLSFAYFSHLYCSLVQL